MSSEVAARRRQRLRKYLRPLPRKATLHRYPVLKYFKDTLRSRSYLWSYKPPHSTRAIYIGSLVTFLPLIGVQILIGAALAFALRANIVVVSGLQFVSNPLTGPFMYLMSYQVGGWILGALGVSSRGIVTDSAIYLFAGGLPLGLALGAAIHFLVWINRRRGNRNKKEQVK